MISSEIVTLHSNKPGPTLAIFAGVHGNEKAGVYALQQLSTELKIIRGKVLLVFANPPAIEAKVRMVNKNLNRCFLKDNKGDKPEDIRARELMRVLDGCDALLDLHMFYDDNGLPFAICEDNSLEIAKLFEIDIISTNWNEVEAGATDGYMYQQGKVGVCVECGPISKAEEYTAFARKTVYQFLSYYKVVDPVVSYSSKSKRIIRAEKTVYKSSKDFKLRKGLSNFDALHEGRILATDGSKKLTAQSGECIIFPHYNARIGEEAYVIGIEEGVLL